MNIADRLIALLLVFIPPIIVLLVAILQNRKIEKITRQNDDVFNVFVPEAVMYLGVLLTTMCSALILIPTFFDDVHWTLYLCVGIMIWLGIYMIVQTLAFRIVVNAKKITVYSPLRKPHTFTFDDIVFVKRQVKKNMTRSERIVIKTKFGKKVIAENAEVSYKRLIKRIAADVNKTCLHGFE